MNSPKIKTVILPLFILLAALHGGGCASSAPSAKFSQKIAGDDYIMRGDNTTIEVSSDEGVVIHDYEKQRLETQIEVAIEALVKEQKTTQNRNYLVEVKLTRYDKGNAFARAMLAGLGQIRIDATVTLKNKDSDKVLGQFDVNKQFAFGGVYGASTNMEDVEIGLATGIAEALTGIKDSDSSKKKD